ncbi:MAG: PPC domain-containing protein [Candidatus Eisenbacteria bacterium]|nr:PPC domain-containing protein [Candidatus Eisenbacteria bacterium]
MARKRYHVLATTLTAVLALTATMALAADVPEIEDEAKWTEQMGAYSVAADVPEVEPNNTAPTANAFSCGDVLRPAAITAADNDYIVFTATAGQIISFGTDADGTPTVDTFIHLYAADGTTQLASDDDAGPGAYSLLNFTATYTGTYYGRIRGFGATSAGLYKAFITCNTPPPLTCDIPNYKGDIVTVSPPLAIPDNNLGGVVVGTLPTANDGTRFLDVIVSLRMTHTWLGDIVATLSYDQDCDGLADASSKFICRPARASCIPTVGTGFGCPSNLLSANNIYISDASTAVIGTAPFSCGTSAFNIPGGCYRGNANADPLSVFDNFRKGGCFTLHVGDNGVGDTGTISEWGVYTLNEAIVPVAITTWGAIKSLPFGN